MWVCVCLCWLIGVVYRIRRRMKKKSASSNLKYPFLRSTLQFMCRPSRIGEDFFKRNFPIFNIVCCNNNFDGFSTTWKREGLNLYKLTTWPYSYDDCYCKLYPIYLPYRFPSSPKTSLNETKFNFLIVSCIDIQICLRILQLLLLLYIFCDLLLLTRSNEKNHA